MFDKIEFPFIKNIATQNSDKIAEIKSRIFKENRENKINSLLENKKYKEKKIKDDDEYKKVAPRTTTAYDLVSVKPMSKPSVNIHYIDFKYKK